MDSSSRRPTDVLKYEIGNIVYGEAAVNSLDFHRDGKWLLMSTNDNAVHLIDALTGEEKKKLYAKTDGMRNVCFTHHESCVLFSSERNNCDIKYLCTYDNRYLRYFRGHTGRITSLSMCPADDSFLTASVDKSIRLWDLSAPNPTAKLALPPRCDSPYARYDASGMVFGVLCRDIYTSKHQLKLFDARNFSAGPFQEILPEQHFIEGGIRKASPDWSPARVRQCIDAANASAWSSFEFSSDGNHILINTQSDLLLVLDGFRADVEPLAITSTQVNRSTTVGEGGGVDGGEDRDTLLRANGGGSRLGASFSPDSQYVLAASSATGLNTTNSGGGSSNSDDSDAMQQEEDGGEDAGSDDNAEEVLIFNYKDAMVTESGRATRCGALKGHVAPVGCIACDPKYDLIATACVNTALWIPKAKDGEEATKPKIGE
mmetsp:Transcript_13619/g.22721  ORF Transcript_13619/g.22721 Transcript_13619/m.22721 type:complete len:430 (-) Transcript_13619:392-1681(-)